MRNPYYNKSIMNLKQLARDLEKQGFICFIDYIEIALTGYMDWSVTYYRPFKAAEFL